MICSIAIYRARLSCLLDQGLSSNISNCVVVLVYREFTSEGAFTALNPWFNMSGSRNELLPLNEMRSLPTTTDPGSYGEGYQPVRTDMGAVVTVKCQSLHVIPVRACIIRGVLKV